MTVIAVCASLSKAARVRDRYPFRRHANAWLGQGAVSRAAAGGLVELEQRQRRRRLEQVVHKGLRHTAGAESSLRAVERARKHSGECDAPHIYVWTWNALSTSPRRSRSAASRPAAARHGIGDGGRRIHSRTPDRAAVMHKAVHRSERHARARVDDHRGRLHAAHPVPRQKVLLDLPEAELDRAQLGAVMYAGRSRPAWPPPKRRVIAVVQRRRVAHNDAARRREGSEPLDDVRLRPRLEDRLCTVGAG